MAVAGVLCPTGRLKHLHRDLQALPRPPLDAEELCEVLMVIPGLHSQQCLQCVSYSVSYTLSLTGPSVLGLFVGNLSSYWRRDSTEGGVVMFLQCVWPYPHPPRSMVNPV